MSSFKIIYVPLTEDQINKIECAARFCYALSINLNKNQLASASTDENDNMALPLTTHQFGLVHRALATNSDLKLTFNLHQLSEFMKINEGIEIDIKEANLFYRKHKRVFKN